MRILVTGASGFIGRRLCELLSKDGHELWALSRGNAPVPGCSATVVGDLGEGPPDLGGSAPEAVVHLAGESIAGRWTAARKSRIRESRVAGTRHLAEALAQLPRPPSVAVCASAVGYYGDRGDEELTETSGRGDGFLAEVTEAWEAEQRKLLPRGRVVSLRAGFVLGRGGGGVPGMALPYRFFVGGPVGSGRQWSTWVHRDDVCGLARLALAHAELSGPVNAVGPEPVRGRDFAAAIGKVLHRPAFLPAPAFALRLALGEMARELLLASQRVVPARATAAGYRFAFPQLEAALRDALA
jgi:uncharacterized protein